MELKSSKIPAGVSLSPLAHEVFKVLERYTAFPWPILAAQCKRAGTTPTALTENSLLTLIPLLAAGVGRFTSPEKEAAVQRDLLTMAQGFRFQR